MIGVLISFNNFNCKKYLIMHYELIEYRSFNQVFETAYEITNNVNKRQKPKTFF